MTHKLTNAEATDDLSTVYGAVTGELIAGAVAAHEDVANSAALVYTQNTRNLALTVGRTIGASLSTQVVIPALTQAQAEDDDQHCTGLCDRPACCLRRWRPAGAVVVAADRRTRFDAGLFGRMLLALMYQHDTTR